MIRVVSGDPYLARAIVEPLNSSSQPLNDAAWVVLADIGGQWTIIAGPGTAAACNRPTEIVLRQLLCSDPYRGFKPIR